MPIETTVGPAGTLKTDAVIKAMRTNGVAVHVLAPTACAHCEWCVLQTGHRGMCSPTFYARPATPTLDRVISTTIAFALKGGV